MSFNETIYLRLLAAKNGLVFPACKLKNNSLVQKYINTKTKMVDIREAVGINQTNIDELSAQPAYGQIRVLQAVSYMISYGLKYYQPQSWNTIIGIIKEKKLEALDEVKNFVNKMINYTYLDKCYFFPDGRLAFSEDWEEESKYDMLCRTVIMSILRVNVARISLQQALASLNASKSWLAESALNSTMYSIFCIAEFTKVPVNTIMNWDILDCEDISNYGLFVYPSIRDDVYNITHIEQQSEMLQSTKDNIESILERVDMTELKVDNGILMVGSRPLKEILG